MSIVCSFSVSDALVWVGLSPYEIFPLSLFSLGIDAAWQCMRSSSQMPSFWLDTHIEHM